MAVKVHKKQEIQEESSVGIFEGKIPFITELIKNSVGRGCIKKIYLFGSYAYGKPDKDSDIDIYVIINDKYNEFNAYMKIMKELMHNEICAVDLMVDREKDLKVYLSKNPNNIENIIIREGTLLYG